ncbi:protein SCAR3 [Gossypium australe]|uniref:Protein SCAR3 n=1 Tax=Gossypium australe TaxID=47621 RepID=A0A5B6WBP3_9ROSI|nr:protein SCAR3 [Gossypium australe]
MGPKYQVVSTIDRPEPLFTVHFRDTHVISLKIEGQSRTFDQTKSGLSPVDCSNKMTWRECLAVWAMSSSSSSSSLAFSLLEVS